MFQRSPRLWPKSVGLSSSPPIVGRGQLPAHHSRTPRKCCDLVLTFDHRRLEYTHISWKRKPAEGTVIYCPLGQFGGHRRGLTRRPGNTGRAGRGLLEVLPRRQPDSPTAPRRAPSTDCRGSIARLLGVAHSATSYPGVGTSTPRKNQREKLQSAVSRYP
jgi:hypothetical protein